MRDRRGRSPPLGWLDRPGRVLTCRRFRFCLCCNGFSKLATKIELLLEDLNSQRYLYLQKMLGKFYLKGSKGREGTCMHKLLAVKKAPAVQET